MAWMTVTEPMERVLSSISAVPGPQRLGPIDGVMVKTFRKHVDQRGYFIEQLKRETSMMRARSFIPDHPFAQMSRSLAYAAEEIRRS